MRSQLDEDLDHVVRVTGRLWDSIRGARLFVTGGSGFFGRWVVTSLLRADEDHSLGVSLTILTRDAERFRAAAPEVVAHPSVRLHPGDVRSFAFPEEDADLVLHLATVPTPPADPATIFDTVVAGTRRTLDYAIRAHVRRFLFVSSGAVYGRQPPGLALVPEGHMGAPDPLDPAAANGGGKRAGEQMAVLEGRRSGFVVTIARGFAFVGPHLPLDGSFAAGNFIRDALRGGPIRVLGDGTPVRSYLYAADLAAWLLTIAIRGADGRAYNVGSESAISIADLAKAVAAAFDPAPAIENVQSPEPGRVPERYVPSTRRAREELGLKQTIGLESALARTISWHRRTAPSG